MKHSVLGRLHKLSWLQYWTAAAGITVATSLSFAVLYAALLATRESLRVHLWDGFRLSVASMAGTAASVQVRPAIEIVVALQAVVWLVLSALLVATLTTRLSSSRSTAHILPKAACHTVDGGLVLECRLIVYPNAALIQPRLSATLNVVNSRGERENIALDVVPSNVPKVQWYLGFDVMLPKTLRLFGPEAPVRGSVDVFASAWDEGSDQTLLIHECIEVPEAVQEGRFVDAVVLTPNGRIEKVLPEKLALIERQTQDAPWL